MIALLDKWRHSGFNVFFGPRILIIRRFQGLYPRFQPQKEPYIERGSPAVDTLRRFLSHLALWLESPDVLSHCSIKRTCSPRRYCPSIRLGTPSVLRLLVSLGMLGYVRADYDRMPRLRLRRERSFDFAGVGT